MQLCCVCAQVSDEGSGGERNLSLPFLLYDNLGQLVPNPCLSTAGNLFWAGMKLMEHFIGAGHVCGVAAL